MTFFAFKKIFTPLENAADKADNKASNSKNRWRSKAFANSLTGFTARYCILLLAIWQLFAVLLMALGIWPQWIVWVNLALLVIFMVFSETFDSVILLVVSLPFSVVLPQAKFSSFQLWRVLFGLLFLIWLFRDLKFKWNFRETWGKIVFLGWDKFLGIFLAVAALSLLWSRFPAQGLRQIVFWLNIYIFYLVIVNAAKTRRETVDLIKAAAISLSLIVLLGYAQLIVTFFMNLGTFWIYWASFISKLYYGPDLASVLLYSNSWFAYSSGGVELRMFSIMPDSHSFALVAIYCVSFLLPLTYFTKATKPAKKSEPAPPHPNVYLRNIKIVDPQGKTLGLTVNYYLWLAIRFAGLAIILSGTRAAWVGLLAPLFILVVSYYTDYLKVIVKKTLWPYLIIILFFILSPFINQALHYARVSQFKENFLERARSIYDLAEVTNIGRIEIWKQALKYAAGHPWGAGLNNFIVSLDTNLAQRKTYAELSEFINPRVNLPNKYVTAHNLFFHILVETGIAGLAAFLFFWWKYFVRVEEFIKKRKNDNNIFIFFVFEIALTFVWFLAAGMFDVTLLNDKVLIYFFISLGLSGIIIKNYDSLKEG